MFEKIVGHFMTVHEHRKCVRRMCFEVGLIYQGITHDLTKYAPAEFLVGCRYYSGVKSPNNGERNIKGISYAWLHHKGRNRHHNEYWVDYSFRPGEKVRGMRMPKKYVVEMFIDRVAAAKTYQGEAYMDASPLIYFEKGKDHMIMHPESKRLLETLLTILADKGEEAALRYIRRYVIPERNILRNRTVRREAKKYMEREREK